MINNSSVINITQIYQKIKYQKMNPRDKKKMIATQLKEGLIIAEKYQVISQLGQGASSVVIKAKNIVTGQIVAIKKIKSFLTNIHESTRVLRQIILLRQLKHPNIIQLIDIIIEEKQQLSVYLVLQFVEKDIKHIFFSNKTLTLQEIKSVVFQILTALKYCHECQVLHRDLKPQNILTDSDLKTIKLCDFGLARTVIYDQLDSQYTRMKAELNSLGIKRQSKIKDIKTSNLSIHVATRWYRAPELILLQKKYNSAIDIWSVGCILGELLSMMKDNGESLERRKPMFPGKACYPLSPPKSPQMSYKKVNDFPHSVFDQLSMIFAVIGTPEDIQCINDQRARNYIKSFGKIQKTPFKQIFNYLPSQIQDLLQRCLKFKPNQRISVIDAINHPLFDSVRKQYESSTYILGSPITMELNQLKKEDLYQLVLKEQEHYQKIKASKMEEEKPIQMIPQ